MKPSAKPKPAKPPAVAVELAADVFFDPGQAALRPDSRTVLDGILEEASKATIGAVIVTGYADRAEKSPRALTEARAREVRQYLVLKGVDERLIFWVGKPDAQPLGKTRTPLDQAKNRRVEVEIVGQRFAATPQQSALDPRVDVVPVLFATNRRKTRSTQPDRAPDPEAYFSDQEIDPAAGEAPTLGRAFVRVPPTHTRGSVERPGWIRLSLQKLTTNETLQAFGVQSYKAADARRHFTFAQPIEELDDQAFRSELKKSLASAGSRSAVVYVHGYANSFADAAFRAAQLTFDLRAEKYDTVPLVFSWPSDAGGINYLAAKDRARSAGWHLAEFLNKVADSAGVNVVHIVTHSMGAEVLGYALNTLGVTNLAGVDLRQRVAPKFNQIVLAAPDVRAQDFEKVILPAIKSRHRITNYASSNDWALRLSKKGNAGARAGDSGPQLTPVEGVETIDASAVNNELVGHAFFAESPRMIRDLAQLLSVGAPPQSRGLTPRQRNQRTYWVISQ